MSFKPGALVQIRIAKGKNFIVGYPDHDLGVIVSRINVEREFYRLVEPSPGDCERSDFTVRRKGWRVLLQTGEVFDYFRTELRWKARMTPEELLTFCNHPLLLEIAKRMREKEDAK